MVFIIVALVFVLLAGSLLAGVEPLPAARSRRGGVCVLRHPQDAPPGARV